MKLIDTSRLQEYLKVEPNERTEQLINQIYNEVYFFEFFRYLNQSSQKNFILNYCCKFMTCIYQKKKQIEQNRDNIWIMLEGQLNIYIPTQASNQDEQQYDKPKKKYVSMLTQGQCLNLTTVCFKKITSFYYECTDQVVLLSIPSFVDSISLIKQIYPIVKADYDSIFETLIQFDQFYTQQQVRDILFVSKKCVYNKGNIQLKGNGLIIFIVQGEFSIFKDFYKEQVQQKENQFYNRYQKKEDDLEKNHTQDSEDEYNTINSNQTQNSTGTQELQKLKMKFKKRNTQVFKRIQLGIKKPGSLAVLGKKEDSVDGIECLDGEGVVFICTEDQYNQITKEQERKSNAYQAVIACQNIQNTNRAPDNSQDKNELIDKKKKSILNQNSLIAKIQTKLASQQDKNSKKIPFQDQLKQVKNNESFKELQQEEEIVKQQQTDENTTTTTILGASKGDQLRSKYELDYRKSLINNIGQQLNTFANFIYSNKKIKKEVLAKENIQKQNGNENNLNVVNEKLDLQISQSNANENVQSPLKLPENDEQKLSRYLIPSSPEKRQAKKKTLPVNPLYHSQKGTLRGMSQNKLPSSQENIVNQTSLTNNEQSNSPSAFQEQHFIRETSIQKRIAQNENYHLRNESNKQNRSKSLFQTQTPTEIINNPTPSTRLGKQMIANNSIESHFDVPNSPIKIVQQNSINFTSKYNQIISLSGQNHQRTEYSDSPTHFLDYNFVSTPNNKINDINTPNSLNYSNVQTKNFTERCQSAFVKSQTSLKKSNHFINSEKNLLKQNFSSTNKDCKKIDLKVRISTCDTYSFIPHRQPEVCGSQSHRQFTNQTQGDEYNTCNTFSSSNLNQYQNSSINKFNKMQRSLKETPKNNINKLSSNSNSEASQNKQIFSRRAQSAKNLRVQSNKINLEIQKQNNEQICLFIGSNTTTNKDKLQDKNIIQILYPQKASISERKQISRVQKSKKQQFNHLTINSPNKLNQENGVQKSLENEFKIFLQKKLRPQSALNRYQGEQQINQLNKKVFGQFMQSLNNTPSNQEKKQQQLSISANNFQSIKLKTFSSFSQIQQQKNKLI
ncbi:hypothetical protein TTHERM_00765100 (macronuclear) [Tetrahymena thermophila SB210]|uniref:Uncharacterized protein n=1 Tax=Tetrahymena thermophila (strain SB210) TaxID=312017 RepID=I7MAQ9_TETTS|nr:hypothetical protein TTHERM_00765100 [Tetrahymena thermophila SB210]EAS05125.2 hypothetical protein TTHERM_00765100 [Tetrahymena thermophila SB210]|eukprot:XP_001025370.2 hypothetical protein TTHERM_00765100 [Tetrahymena thermophila SB210]